ncbi:MAG: AAA family ATPase [Pseudomonadota bacterium]
MPKARVHILGASGSGTTTLGRLLAERLTVPFHDTDAFYWLPTDPPFREKRDIPERCRLLRAALSQSESWVLSGSLCSWGHEFIPDFTTVVFVELAPEIRMARLREREIRRYGIERLQPGGELHAQHLAFMSWAARYDEPHNDGRSRAGHERWLAELPASCNVLRLRSELPVSDLVRSLLDQLAG